MEFIPDEMWEKIQASIPVLCVDFIPVAPDGKIGLILRESPFGRVWCHLGGRVRYNEELEQAVLRHLEDTLPGSVAVSFNALAPVSISQWFPNDDHPNTAGRDPRKHAVSLVYALFLEKVGVAANEALEVIWVKPDELPTPLWPGSLELIRLVIEKLTALG